MNDEQMESAERGKVIRMAFKELFAKGFRYKEILSHLGPAWHDWKEEHPQMKPIRVRIIEAPQAGQQAEDTKRLGNSELLRREARVDIPFSELSPRAQKLYLDAIKEVKMTKEHEYPVKHDDSKSAEGEP